MEATVLIAAVGLTPQVVTETLYALLVSGRRRGPVEVHLLTTAAGRRAALERLLGRPQGALRRLCRDYHIPAGRIRFAPEQVRVLKAADGRPLPDIRSSDDNAAVADQILAFVRQQAARPGVVLHGSIAGGRKTMSMWLGTAFMLYGRPGDRLTHVLVSPEFEGAPDFFYPPPRACPIRLADGRQADASRARVELADIPFLRLGHLLPVDARGEPARSRELLEATQRVLDESAPSPLTVAVAGGLVRVGPRPIPMQTGPLALYALAAAQKAERCVQPNLPACGACRECFLALGKDFPDELRDRLVALYRALGGRQPERFAATLGGGQAAERLRSLRSKANAAVRRALGATAGPYLIEALGAYNRKRYGLLLDKGRIQLARGTGPPPA